VVLEREDDSVVAPVCRLEAETVFVLLLKVPIEVCFVEFVSVDEDLAAELVEVSVLSPILERSLEVATELPAVVLLVEWLLGTGVRGSVDTDIVGGSLGMNGPRIPVMAGGPGSGLARVDDSVDTDKGGASGICSSGIPGSGLVRVGTDKIGGSVGICSSGISVMAGNSGPGLVMVDDSVDADKIGGSLGINGP
jgi:hypothetical protein